MYSENNQKHRKIVRNESGEEDWGPIMQGTDCEKTDSGLRL